MADINTLIAELRAGLGEGDDGVYIAPPAYIRALLDHIESSDREMDALLAERAEFKRRAEAAEAELARLRKPVSEGEVKGVVRSLSLIACAPRCEHASECNCTVLDNAADLIQRLAAPVTEGEVGEMVTALNDLAEYVFQQPPVDYEETAAQAMKTAAELLQRLAGQVAEATARAETERQIAEAVELRVTQQEHLLEERRQRISDLIRDGLAEIGKREAAEARLREAVEVMRPFAVHGEYVDFHFPDDGDDVVAAGLPDNPITLGHFRRARAFLATLEDHSNG
jgi:hypothetical protein